MTGSFLAMAGVAVSPQVQTTPGNNQPRISPSPTPIDYAGSNVAINEVKTLPTPDEIDEREVFDDDDDNDHHFGNGRDPGVQSTDNFGDGEEETKHDVADDEAAEEASPAAAAVGSSSPVEQGEEEEEDEGGGKKKEAEDDKGGLADIISKQEKQGKSGGLMRWEALGQSLRERRADFVSLVSGSSFEWRYY